MRLVKALGLAALGTALALGSAAAQEKTWDTVRIASEGAYAPWNIMTPDGKLDGFEIDLARNLCDRMKVKCEIVAQDWDGMIPALNAGKFDAIMAGMNITDKRKEVIGFSIPYAVGPHGFGVMKDSPLVKLPGEGERADLTKDPQGSQKIIDAEKPMLKGKVVGVQGSTVNSGFLEKYFKDTIEIREYKTTEQHDLDLAAGRVDAIFASQSALIASKEKPDLKDMVIAGPKFAGGVLGAGVAVGLRKSDTKLKEMFDKAIQSAIDDGTVRTLALKWFKIDMTPQS